MWRSVFIAIGTVLLIFGVEFLVIDKAIWARDDGKETAVIQRPDSFSIRGSSTPNLFDNIQEKENTNPREFEPAAWLPWGMLSTGAIVILYSLTLRRGGYSGGD